MALHLWSSRYISLIHSMKRAIPIQNCTRNIRADHLPEPLKENCMITIRTWRFCGLHLEQRSSTCFFFTVRETCPKPLQFHVSRASLRATILLCAKSIISPVLTDSQASVIIFSQSSDLSHELTILS